MQVFLGVLVLLSIVYQLCFRYETIVDQTYPDRATQRDTLTGKSRILPPSEIRKKHNKPIHPDEWIAQANKIMTSSFFKKTAFEGSMAQPFVSIKKEYNSNENAMHFPPAAPSTQNTAVILPPSANVKIPLKPEKPVHLAHKKYGLLASSGTKKALPKPAIAFTNQHSIYYQTPSEMKLNQATLYRVDIPLDKNTEKQIQDAFSKDGHFDISKIKTSKYMTAVLSGDDAFSIKSASQTAQFADADTKRFSWQWYVTPTQAGQHVLTLTVYAGKGEDVSYRDAWEREINVEVPSSEWGYLITKYLVNNWVWLSPLVLFLFGLLQNWWKKKNEKKPKTKKGKKLDVPVSADAKKKKTEATKV